MDKKYFVVFLAASFILVSSLVSAASPVLYFSDLIDGPKSGWEGSATKGAAVTIWGNGFGSIRGSSYVTVNGVQLTSDSDYAEWDALGNARGMERITFWLNSNMNLGQGTITVTVNGATSNPLPFYVRTTGNIYFVDHNNGNDNYNGKYSTFQGGSNGPRRTINAARSLMIGGDILYIRTGTYTEEDSWNSVLFLAPEQKGSANAYTAFVGYPGELPLLDSRSSATYYSAIRHYYGDDIGYMIVSKMKIYVSVGGAVTITDNPTGYIRVIGLDIDGLNANAGGIWSGVIDFHDCSNGKVFGCKIHNWGIEKYDHAVYIGNNIAGTDELNYELSWNEVYDLGDDVSGLYIHPQDTDGGNPPSFADLISIHDNLCYNLEHACIIMYSRTKNIDIYNNIAYNCGTQGGRSAVQLTPDPYYKTNIKFYNNVIYSYSVTALLDIGSSNFNGDLKNNIFYSLSGTPYLYIESGTTITSDYDLYYNDGAAPSWATNALNTNPLFINPTSDFHLQSSSPAIDAGIDVSAIVTKDFDSNSRPQGSAFDIGAYEYVSSLPMHPADTNQNGIIEMKELIAFIGLWKQGSANVNDVMTALDRWFRGM